MNEKIVLDEQNLIKGVHLDVSQAGSMEAVLKATYRMSLIGAGEVESSKISRMLEALKANQIDIEKYRVMVDAPSAEQLARSLCLEAEPNTAIEKLAAEIAFCCKYAACDIFEPGVELGERPEFEIAENPLDMDELIAGMVAFDEALTELEGLPKTFE